MRRIMQGVGALAFVVGACGGGGDKTTSPTVNAGDVVSICGSRAAIAFGSTFASALYGDGSVDYSSEASALQAGADAAPSVLRGDFQLVAKRLKPFLESFADAHGDYTALARSVEFKTAIGQLARDDYKAATTHIDAWFAAHCRDR